MPGDWAISVALLGNASAQDVTLRAIFRLRRRNQFSTNFERFIEKVNKDGKGVIQINYIGGPRAMPPFEVGNAIRSGVVDIANAPGAFYANVMPEADSLKLFCKPMSEQRKNGTWTCINELHNQKLNSQYLTRLFITVPYQHLPQQEDRQGRLQWTEDPRHADLPRFGHRARRARP